MPNPIRDPHDLPNVGTYELHFDGVDPALVVPLLDFVRRLADSPNMDSPTASLTMHLDLEPEQVKRLYSYFEASYTGFELKLSDKSQQPVSVCLPRQ